ncbi:MAG: hypothetical protein HOP11_13550 [Saprospiraceae bacterium]|nr:hypothetical protein [Saprospiraceae bacterium]
MDKIVLICLVSLFTSIISCKKEKTVYGDYEMTRFTSRHFKVPFPDGVYKPQEMKPLDMLEMIIYKEKSNMEINYPLKDFHGNEITKDSVYRLNYPYFVQLYSNESGKVAMGVVFPVTKDFQNAILNWK